MQQTPELNALFTLIDDPDVEVFDTVSEKISGFGKAIIPNLENLWENTLNEEVQQRIEAIIHKLHFTDLKVDITNWSNGGCQDLLAGILLTSKYQKPDLNSTPILQDIEKIRRNIWLELNSFLTPLEQANVLTSILYNYYQLKGNEVNYNKPEEFFIHHVLSTRSGNSISNGIIYQILCELLDIPARIINIPRQFVIAFYQSDFGESFLGHPQQKINFYVDATTGQAYAHNDIENYFKKMNIEPKAEHFKPKSNKKIMQTMLEELARCYNLHSNMYKQDELLELVQLLKS